MIRSDSLSRRTHVTLLAGAAVLLALAVLAASAVLAPGVDWRGYFRPATLALLRGENPYTAVPGYYSPPWTLLLLAPLALLPERIGYAALTLAALAAFAALARRYRASPVALALFLFSPPVLHCLLVGNVDWLALLGLLLPPRWGLFLVTIKPQVGAGLALFWIVEAWRAERVRGVLAAACATLRRLWPIAAATALSFLLYGFWPATWVHAPRVDTNYAATLFPYAVPAGLWLLVRALFKSGDSAISTREGERAALAAAPLLSPHALIHSYAGALLALASSTWELAGAVAGFWAVFVWTSIRIV